jgi:hypothetical protein
LSVVVAYFLFLQSLIGAVAAGETALQTDSLGWTQALCLGGDSGIVDPEDSDRKNAHIVHCVLCAVGQSVVGGTAVETETTWKVADRVGPPVVHRVAAQSTNEPRNARAPPNV